MRIKTLISILVIVFLISSCASIIHGPTQMINFTSLPTKAKITIDGKVYGLTPKSIILRRIGRLKSEPRGKKSYKVKIEADGYSPYELEIKRKIDGWVIGNIVIGGTIGIIIDGINGSMYRLTPKQVDVAFGKTSSFFEDHDESIYIALTMTPDENWEKIGELMKK